MKRTAFKNRGAGLKRGGRLRVRKVSKQPTVEGARRTPLRSRPDRKMAAWTRFIKERDGGCRVQNFSGMNAYEFTGLACAGPLDAHHIAERSLRPDLKYDVTNGIALCRAHHDWIPLHRKEAIRLGLLSDQTYELAQKRKAL